MKKKNRNLSTISIKTDVKTVELFKFIFYELPTK